MQTFTKKGRKVTVKWGLVIVFRIFLEGVCPFAVPFPSPGCLRVLRVPQHPLVNQMRFQSVEDVDLLVRPQG